MSVSVFVLKVLVAEVPAPSRTAPPIRGGRGGPGRAPEEPKCLIVVAGGGRASCSSATHPPAAHPPFGAAFSPAQTAAAPIPTAGPGGSGGGGSLAGGGPAGRGGAGVAVPGAQCPVCFKVLRDKYKLRTHVADIHSSVQHVFTCPVPRTRSPTTSASPTGDTAAADPHRPPPHSNPRPRPRPRPNPTTLADPPPPPLILLPLASPHSQPRPASSDPPHRRSQRKPHGPGEVRPRPAPPRGSLEQGRGGAGRDGPPPAGEISVSVKVNNPIPSSLPGRRQAGRPAAAPPR
ncbi:hypothetical protein E2C01_061293 [Portunus trituberculatus]|uniref:C2H2-type domain-containing protein n=1 Tax=Portunus trituberculatus TaxID=210409 RepID=A0A5B7HCS6_PORTR|nr:hypothetical protein [Portunus trituberculatus]